MTSVQLSALAGILLSVLFEYVPGLNTWYGKLTDTWQRLMMLGMLIVVALGAFGLSCGSFISAVSCDKQGIVNLIQAIVAAVVANQATFLISPKTKTS